MSIRMRSFMLVLGLLGLSSPLWAEPPTTWEARYGIHETPTDPQSPLTFTIKLSLERASLSGNSIGWRVASVQIRQLDASGNAVDLWVETNPVVQTTDGLWWIDHADAENLYASEFVLPPHIAGTADAQDPNHAALSYDIQGVPCEPPPAPEPPPYQITAAMNWRFMRVGEQNPISEGEDKPIEAEPPNGV